MLEVEAIQEIAKLGREAAAPQLFAIDDARKAVVMSDENGQRSLQLFDMPAKRPFHQFNTHSLEAMSAIVYDRLGGRDEKLPLPIVFDKFSSEARFEETGYSFVRCHFEYTDMHISLEQFAGDDPMSFDQRGILRWLRRLPVDPAFVASMRSLDFTVMSRTKQVRVEGSQSLDRSVTAELVGVAGKPTSFIVPHPIFTTPELSTVRWNARFELEFDLDNLKVEVWWNKEDHEDCCAHILQEIEAQIRRVLPNQTVVQASMTTLLR